MPENISGVPAGRSVFHLTSPLIGLLARVVESLFWDISSGVPVIRPQWEANGNGASKFPQERREEQKPLERTGLRSSAVSVVS